MQHSWNPLKILPSTYSYVDEADASAIQVEKPDMPGTTYMSTIMVEPCAAQQFHARFFRK